VPPGTRRALVAIGIAVFIGCADRTSAHDPDTVSIRGHRLRVHTYGHAGDPPILVSSGDGGWIHLGPHVARLLAAHGFFVHGVDVKTYLESFTSGSTTVRPVEEPEDYAAFAAHAARQSMVKPILVGVSEGAGLSVLAAADPRLRHVVGGVIAVGLPDRNELGWRWTDSIIYLTHGVPREPTFSAAAIVDKLGPLPLALIQSTRDAFVPMSEARRIFASASDPKMLWTVDAADHRFSDKLAELDDRLLDAVEWVARNQPR